MTGTCPAVAPRGTIRRIGLLLGGWTLVLAACGGGPELQPLMALDTSAFEPAVRNAVEAARVHLDAVAAQKPAPARLAEAYGELAMTYHAQDLVAPAAVAYADARLLAPRDKRWPYLQAHLFNDAARVPEALAAFEAALALDGRDPAILQSLAQACLQAGRLDRARTLFERLGEDPSARAAAAAGLGRTALAARDYGAAIAHLEAALRLAPGASQLRQPLATAYQGAGEPAKAADNLRRFAADGAEPLVADPAVDALAAKVVSSNVLLRRGQRAAKAARFEQAEQAFRLAVAADPKNAEALANHGISLVNLGRLDEARGSLERSLRLDDSIALAHLSLGVLHDREGDDPGAIAEYEATLRHDAGNVQAAIYLADALMRTGRPLLAAERYRAARQSKSIDPTRLLHSLALAYLKGGRLAEARGALEEGLALQPADPFCVNALARVMATADDPRVRDRPRALEMARKLFEAHRVPDAGQTYAMALAGAGRFEEAVRLQQETIVAATRAGAPASRDFLVANLERYKRHLPAPSGWASDDPLFAPRSPAASRRPS